MPGKKHTVSHMEAYCVLERRWGRRCQGVRRGHPGPQTERRAWRLKVTFAKALEAGGGHSQSGKGQRRGTVTAQGPKGSGGRGRCTALPPREPTAGPHLTGPRSPHQEVTLKEAPGAPPRVLHTSRRPGGRPTVIRFGRRLLGQPLGRGASLPSCGGGGPGHRKDTRVRAVAGRGLTGGRAGSQGRVQEASRAGPGGCSRCYGAMAKSGAQHDGDGGTQAEAEEKPAVRSLAARRFAGNRTHVPTHSGRSMRSRPLRRSRPGGRITARLRPGYGGPLRTNCLVAALCSVGSLVPWTSAAIRKRAADGIVVQVWLRKQLHHLEMGMITTITTNYNKNALFTYALV